MASKIQSEQVTQASASDLDCVPGVTCGFVALAIATPEKGERMSYTTWIGQIVDRLEAIGVDAKAIGVDFRTYWNKGMSIPEVIEYITKERS